MYGDITVGIILSIINLSEKIGVEDYELLEEQKSAFKDDLKRKEFNRIISMIKNNRLKILIVWDLDRIYRNRKKLVGFFELCKNFRCEVYSVRQTFLNEIQEIKLPEGFDFIKDMMINNFIQFLGWIAEDESKKKSERVKIAFQNSTKKWGRKPLENVEKRVIELHKEGKSIREISKAVHYWDKARNKKQVSPTAVHKIIKQFKGSLS